MPRVRSAPSMPQGFAVTDRGAVMQFTGPGRLVLNERPPMIAASRLVALACWRHCSPPAPARAQPIDLSQRRAGRRDRARRLRMARERPDGDRQRRRPRGARQRHRAGRPAGGALPQEGRRAGRSRRRPPPPATPADVDTGSNEIYRLDAIGHVRIVTPTDEAVGDKAVYDIDQAVLVMTGTAMRLTTPQYVMTARDSMEYWSQQHMAVGRGNAVVVATDGRRLSADVLVGYIDRHGRRRPAAQPRAGASRPAAGRRRHVPPASWSASRRSATSRCAPQTDTVRGDRGVYVPDTGIARVVGNVQVIHGQNEITGAAADVNMKTGIAHVIADPARRVQGLIMPNDRPQVPGRRQPAQARPRAGRAAAMHELARGAVRPVPAARCRGGPGRHRRRQDLPQAPGGAERLDLGAAAARRWACSGPTAPARPRPST